MKRYKEELEREISEYELNTILSHDNIGDVGTSYESTKASTSYNFDDRKSFEPNYYSKHLDA